MRDWRASKDNRLMIEGRRPPYGGTREAGYCTVMSAELCVL